ncbi:MAG TPA: alpha/beta hydrolase [Acidimicrobiales bacterium]|nr:alpha/beta hydrolase [Acidimicrobiales bacterium]
MSTTLVLVHGSGHTARTWDRVVARLRHPAIAIDLPGRRYNPADLTVGTLERSARSAAADIEADGAGPMVLVGHSSGGLILPALATLVGGSVRHLVFVAGLIAPDGGHVATAIVGEDGSSVAQQRRSLLREHAGTTFGGFLPGEAPAPTTFRRVDDERIVGAIESLNLMYQTVRWDGVAPSLPRTFVRCLRDPIQPRSLQAQLIAASGAAEVVDLDCDHTPALSAPDELAALLDAIAARHDTPQT